MGVLIRPIISEKRNAQGEALNTYGFIVDRSANKIEIRKAVESKYGVSVERVNTYIHPGKPKKRHTKGGLVEGRTQALKKAFVTLLQGDVIDFYSGI